MRSRAGVALRVVLHECDPAHADRFRGGIRNGLHEPAHELSGDLVRRGNEKGDVRPDAEDPLLSDMIPAMMTYRVKMCGSELPDGELADVIDRVVVPVLRVEPARAGS
ncbi:TetR/AcrR family transcriptional regulator C-terminal ligand-binding domain-containing protein [Streptomyces sp. RerS4]|nr:TetR/AcrR family transcriptional regulator C-terminal ligand-binding domain-containing protein [Streptomyces sp. RerS4]